MFSELNNVTIKQLFFQLNFSFLLRESERSKPNENIAADRSVFTLCNSMDADRPQPTSTPQIIIVKKEEEETIIFCIF